MTINELRVKRNQAWEAAKAFVETQRDKDGLLTDEDAKTYAQMEKKVQDYGAEIARMEAMEAMDAQLAKPTSTPITEKPGNNGGEQKPKTGRAAEAYKEAMLKAFRTNFRQIANVLSEGIDADGGYLVPEEYDTRLIKALEEENIFRKLATTITTGGERKINIAATKPAAAWIDEGEALTFGDATFSQINLDAHKLHVAVKVTEELLYDNAFKLEQYILSQFAKALGNAENAAFLCNDQTIGYLRKLKDQNGHPLWHDSVEDGEPGRILGYKVYTSPYFPVITAGMPAIAFGDYSYYNIGDRGTRSFAELKELFAGNGMIGFVAKERVDGKLVLPEAVKLLKMATA